MQLDHWLLIINFLLMIGGFLGLTWGIKRFKTARASLHMMFIALGLALVMSIFRNFMAITFVATAYGMLQLHRSYKQYEQQVREHEDAKSNPGRATLIA
jgi:hypothetical protein